MSRRSWTQTDAVKKVIVPIACIAMIGCLTVPAFAGGFQGRQSQVGGVSITADGVLQHPSQTHMSAYLEELRKATPKQVADLQKPVAMRKVSLKQLNVVLADAIQNNRELPDEVKYLAGLQRIEYVFVYPELNDIVLAGPAEGWVVNGDAAVVGITTGQPVLKLDDLLIAFRTVHNARTQGITCSIDPTEEGYQRLNQLLNSRAARSGRINKPALEAQMKQAFGPQQITISGVPTESHFARVLLSADYRMKRLAMNLERSPIRGFGSYLQLANGAQSANSNPRWWLACNYEPLSRSENRLSWKLNGPGVKCMTDEEVVNAAGQVSAAGNKNSAAKRWADAMTENYEQLAEEIAVFGQLRNIMDMCVIAALIEKEGLADRANCQLPAIRSAKEGFPTEVWHAAKTVAPEVSFVKVRGGMQVTASGGVDITSWQVANQSKADAKVDSLRTTATKDSDSWWWN